MKVRSEEQRAWDRRRRPTQPYGCISNPTMLVGQRCASGSWVVAVRRRHRALGADLSPAGGRWREDVFPVPHGPPPAVRPILAREEDPVLAHLHGVAEEIEVE